MSVYAPRKSPEEVHKTIRYTQTVLLLLLTICPTSFSEEIRSDRTQGKRNPFWGEQGRSRSSVSAHFEVEAWLVGLEPQAGRALDARDTRRSRARRVGGRVA